MLSLFFFFKQKTAYEMRISDWSSDVCSSDLLPLEGLSKWSYNVAGIYEKYGISARVAYNWRSSYLLTTSASNINYPVWADAYGQLDESFLVSVGDHLKIGLQGTNLLTPRTFLTVGAPNLTTS